MVIELSAKERITMTVAIISDIEWHRKLIEIGGKVEYHEAEIKILEELKTKINQITCP